MKLDGLSHMRKKVIRVVAARVQMKLVLDAIGQQLLVHPGGAVGKAVFILLYAI